MHSPRTRASEHARTRRARTHDDDDDDDDDAKVACVVVRTALLLVTTAPSFSSHSNRIVSIINETALGFSGKTRFRVTGFRVSVRPCVYRTRGCVRDAPYLFTHAVEYNCHCDTDAQREVSSRRETRTNV